MQVLPSLSADALRALRGLYELYLYLVFCTFHTGPQPGTPAFDDVDASVASARLRRTLKSLHAAVIPPAGYQAKALDARSAAATDDDPTVSLQHELRMTAGAIQLERLRAPLDGQPMFALSQAVSAMESLAQLASLLGTLRPLLESTLPSSAASLLDGLYSESLAAVPAMATQTYRGIARSLLVLEPATSAIKNRSWAPKEPSAQHNGYVDTLLQLVQQLNTSLGGLEVPKAVHATVLEEAVGGIAEQLVDAYAAAKKVNDEGRALMTRDIKVLQAALDNLTRRGALPAQKLSLGYAEAWARALSLPAEQLGAWAQEQRGYSMKHLTALIMTLGVSAAVLKKKEQQELLVLMQETAAQLAD